MFSREKLLHPATVIAAVALFVSLGGVGYAATQIGTRQIKNNAVTSQKLHRGAVTVTKIGRGAVRGTKIARAGVTSRELAENSVVGGKLANGAVTNAKLGAAAVTNTKLADGSVTGTKLGSGSVGATALANGAVSAQKLAPGAAIAGSGSVQLTSQTVSSGGQPTTLFTFPGIGSLQATCAAGTATTAFVSSAAGATVTASGVNAGAVPAPPPTPFVQRATPAQGATVEGPEAGGDGVQAITWQVASTGAGSLAQGFTAWVTTGASGANCAVTAQALQSANLPPTAP